MRVAMLFVALTTSVTASHWNGTECATFEVFDFRSGFHRAGGMDKGHGHKGGSWSACTHLWHYGMLTAPFLMRLMAFGLRPQTVLEIGGGLGLFSDFLARFIPGGAYVTCIEPEPMLHEVYGRRQFPHRASQLSVNLFGTAAHEAACRNAVLRRRFDKAIAAKPLLVNSHTGCDVFGFDSL